ncbi:hypothetical protein LRY65_02675 [Candidatus Woesebacteria bacterium]|nr:hypothetical protein [Candidatus Woesebacteria bacterium]MCD8507070.1 hypothetical protein [Candidatus Woesebacteria bacterium]MCD8527097.1 hypothetical protein [Candidatus Woesebacteria bacterium]MCD8546726.1 hypothetical protein [Candidatus Woesebacteria bacterium]
MIPKLESPLIRALDDAQDERDIQYINELVLQYNAAESSAVNLLSQMLSASASSSAESVGAREIYRKQRASIGTLVISVLANGMRQAEFISNR